MPAYGSSPFNIIGLTFNGDIGDQGSIGPIGPTGPSGPPGFGPTGPTGYGITAINYLNGFINTVYTDKTVIASNSITPLEGNVYRPLIGLTGGNFSPLKSSEILSNQELIYDGFSSQDFFETVSKLTFKNLKTNSSFVSINLVGANEGSNPGELVQITYNPINLSAAIIGGGPNRSLLINNPGNVQSGLTGTTYNTQDAVSVGLLNVGEQLKQVSSTLYGSNQVKVWTLDPTEASIFYLNGTALTSSNSTTHVHGNHILIKEDSTSTSTKAFTIIFPKEFHTTNRIFYSTFDNINDITDSNFQLENFKNNFSPNIIWQADSYFCPSSGKYDAVNFISLGSRYVGIPVHYNQTTDVEATIQSIPSFPCKPNNLENFYRISFNPRYGLCCNTDCTCNLSYDFECTGYFQEGITCGGSTGPCSYLGACCLFSEATNLVLPCQELSFCNCATVASENNLSYKWNKFTTIKKSCEDFNCINAKNGIGACCDGNGGCVEIAEDLCSTTKGFYQGSGINCSTIDNYNVCSDGIGGCCDSGITCQPGITGTICLSEFKSYFGDGTTCNQFYCSANEIPCYSIIENELLSPGSVYDNSIVVGIFDPNKTPCFGSSIFSGNISSFNVLTGFTSASCELYESLYDYSGYGFDQSTVCDNTNDSYILLISPYDINLDENKVLIDGSSTTNKFKWSNGSVAWGPLVDITDDTVDEFLNNNLSYKEGYIYDSNNTEASKLNLYSNSFLTCASARFDTSALTHIENRPTQSFTGNWTRNYGLYNTIRLTGSEYFYYNIGVSSDGATLSNYTPTTNDLTVARALSVYNIYKEPDTLISSDWYIPSIDELAYIANICSTNSDFNLNSRLVELGYAPLSGFYWSSTGGFTGNEGILSLSGITHGSVAFGINIDIDGIPENMTISKENRSNTHKVRPIKLIRCDKNYKERSNTLFKLWHVPKLSESIIDNQ
jgi:hypothetical protein